MGFEGGIQAGVIGVFLGELSVCALSTGVN